MCSAVPGLLNFDCLVLQMGFFVEAGPVQIFVSNHVSGFCAFNWSCFVKLVEQIDKLQNSLCGQLFSTSSYKFLFTFHILAHWVCFLLLYAADS
jgi:hypothetical protein